MNRHEDTFMEMSELGGRIPGYRPTFDFPDPFIDSDHAYYSRCPVKGQVLIRLRTRRWFGRSVRGWLRREDALKIYELAYFVRGDILELGCFHGLSTSILSRANHNSPFGKRVYSVDLDPDCVERTVRNLRALGLYDGIKVTCESALGAVRRFAATSQRFDLVFVDHSHAYDDVYPVCRELRGVLSDGGFCLFHDFNDKRNRHEGAEDYGVYQAVRDGLGDRDFDFYGIYGCTGLFRSVPANAPAETVVD